MNKYVTVAGGGLGGLSARIFLILAQYDSSNF